MWSNTPSFAAGMMTAEWNMHPSSVRGSANVATRYHRRQLWQLMQSVYLFQLPKHWKENWFRFWLFEYGSVAIFYTYEYGWIPLPYSIDEIDLQFNPYKISSYNGYLNRPVRGIVGLNCEIIKVADDYYGLSDVISHHAERLANLDKAEQINIMNTNMALVAEAEDKKQADQIKSAYEEATTGKPLVAINKNVMRGKQLQTLISRPDTIYLGDKFDIHRRQIINEYLTAVGIPNANYDKRERLNSQEVSQNGIEVQSRRDYVIDHIKEGMERTNQIADLGLSVELRFPAPEGGGDNANYTGRVPAVQA